MFPEPTAHHFQKRCIFIARCWLQYPHTRRWFATLAGLPAGITDGVPRIFSKLQRPYVSARWKTPERLAALEHHYARLASSLSPEAVRELFGPGIVVAAFDDGEVRYDFSLVYDGRFEKEGDITLAMHRRPDGARIGSLTFVIAPDGAGSQMIIGCIQGPNTDVAGDPVKEAAKAMHGMRPKSTLVFLAQEIARAWEIPRLTGVADSAHIYRHAAKRKDIRFGYDAFWEECEGVAGESGFWNLPAETVERPREEMKPNKRPMYARRYKMTAEFRAAITASLERRRPEIFRNSAPGSVDLAHDDLARSVKPAGAA